MTRRAGDGETRRQRVDLVKIRHVTVSPRRRVSVSPSPSAFCFLLSTHCFLLPGLTAGSPRLQAAHWSGLTAGMFNVTSEKRGTPTSACPPDLSTIEAAATTRAPDETKTWMVSR